MLLTARAAADEGTVERARTLATDARRAFEAGRFAEAATFLEQAYAMSKEPTLLYNIGRAHQQAGAKTKAIRAYRRYLDAALDAPDGGAVRATIDQLERELAKERELEERITRGVPAKRSYRALPWVSVGVGVAVIGGGIVCGQLSAREHERAVDAPTGKGAAVHQSNARTYATVANSLFIVGGAVAVVGATWGTFDVIATRRARVSITPNEVRVAFAF